MRYTNLCFTYLLTYLHTSYSLFRQENTLCAYFIDTFHK